MPAINISNIEQPIVSENKTTYVDVKLDLEQNDLQLPGNLYKPSTSDDIVVSTDEAAIRNAIVNIFNTIPGEKVLNPEFGLSLNKFLFDPLTELTAQIIGEEIYNGLARWETRVKIKNIDVQTDIENRQFEISLTLQIPKLSNQDISLAGVLTQEQFTETTGY